MKILGRFWFAAVIIGIIIVFNWFYKNDKYFLIDQSDIINDYKVEQFNGIVINKFIDIENHSFHKIILNENGKERTILFDNEMEGGLFDYTKKGDTLIKDSGTLKVNLKRKNLDTIILIKIYGSGG